MQIMLTCALRAHVKEPKKSYLYWKSSYFNFKEIEYMTFYTYISTINSLTWTFNIWLINKRNLWQNIWLHQYLSFIVIKYFQLDYPIIRSSNQTNKFSHQNPWLTLKFSFSQSLFDSFALQLSRHRTLLFCIPIPFVPPIIPQPIAPTKSI